MKIKAKYNPKSFTGIYLLTLISTALSYFFILFDNPRPFNITEFIIWVIIGNICGLILATIVSILLKRQYLFFDSGFLYYKGSISKKKIEVSQIKSIKFDFEHKGTVKICSESVNVEIMASNFQLTDLYNFLVGLMNINQNIITDEYTKAILSQNVNSWLVREELFIKLIRYAKTLFGFSLIIGVNVYTINEIYAIFFS